VFSTAGATLASPLTFTIDNTQSYGSFALETPEGLQITSPQTPNSDTTSLSGTLNVNVTATSIQFLSTSDTQFALQAVDQAPLPGGSPGTAPAQFGLDVSLPTVASGVVAARSYVGDSTSGVISLVGTSFDASQVTLDLPVGITDYNLTILENPISGSIDTNFPALNELTDGTLTLAGGMYTLNFPYRVSGPINVSGLTIINVYSGQVVATAVVPEPSSLALFVLGVIAVSFLRRRGCRAIRHDL
jgi:hypothetical protein